MILKKIKPGINYSIEVKELVREKRKARRAWQKTRDPEKKTIFNNLNQKLKRLTYKLKNQGITKYLQGLSAEKDSNYSLWRATKRIRRSIVNAPPVRRVDGSWVRGNQDRANLHADHLESVFQPHESLKENMAELDQDVDDSKEDINISHISHPRK